jgi:DNA-binding NtrC family response regulator
MKILIVDDNQDFCTTIADIVTSLGYETQILNSPPDALNYLEKFNRRISLLLLDIEFGYDSKMNGIDVLEHCRRYYPSIPVIMISGKGTIEYAVKATKLGALNFIEKSLLSKDKISEVLTAALQKTGIDPDNREIHSFLLSQGIIGKSKSIINVGDNIIRYGRTDLNVLITGETGTGKKLVAKALHAVSRRAKFPFVTVDIPNIPKELFQSELFGHTKGSFSGATDTKKGLFQTAHLGTLFLDEIGDMSLELQSNLFIPIEEKTVRRVGSNDTEEINVRFISATDKDLLKAMRESQFREQLYHRLRECEIHLAPLRERREDIPDIIDFYLLQHNESNKTSLSFSPAAVEYLQEQSWGGNVRELSNFLRVSLLTTTKSQVELSDILKLISSTPLSISPDEPAPLTPPPLNRTLKEDLANVDRMKIESTLEYTSGNVSKAAAILDVSRETLHNKIRRYEINPQVYRTKKTRKI